VFENPCLWEIWKLEAHHHLTGIYKGFQTPQTHLNYDETNVAPTLKNKPSPLVEEETQFSNINGLGMNINYIVGSDGLETKKHCAGESH
jgi:hypothetical protein